MVEAEARENAWQLGGFAHLAAAEQLLAA